jgi:hypothetical protein
MHPKYDEDFYGWTTINAKLMREGRMSELDIENLIEEIENMGRSTLDQLVNRLSVLIAHLLKCQFQPTMKGHSWVYTIREQRSRTTDILMDNPSLNNRLDGILKKSYQYAVYQAAKDTGLESKVFPKICPYNFEQIMDESFYP